MLTLNDGRPELWQWDTGRTLSVDADCSQVHFSNKVFGRSIDVDVIDGVSIIPDILLQTDKDLNAWAFVGTAENGYTKISKTFKVNRRNKPADYVFTQPDQTSLEEIKEKIEYLESIQDPDAIKNAVDEYLANNPIQIDEKDPTVPDWAKQTTKPKYTATEVGAVAKVNGVKPDANGNVEITIPDSGGNVELDTTLTQSGKAADAKAVGDKIAEITGISLVEPAEDDIPKVFITGVKPTTKDDVLAEMEYVSKTDKFHAYLTIKCQGNSSMNYPKKNFTVKMFSDEARETKLKKSFKDWNHNGNKYVLKANWIDHSHARNIVSARLWGEVVASRPDYDSLPVEMRNSPNNGAVDGFPIKVYYNGTYEGLYTWNIGKDDWQWGMDEDNPNHVLMCAETNTNGNKTATPCNFRALWNGVNESNWSVEVGTNSTALKNSLNNLIQFVMDNDGDNFRNGIGNYLDIQSAIDYYIFVYDICGLDSLARNMLLATYDGKKWICGAYDLDSTFGMWWNGNSFVSAQYACPEDYQENYSLLWERIEANFMTELKARQAELRKTVLSYSNIVTHFERFMDIIGLDLYAEDLTVYTGIPSGSTNNIKQIRNYIRDRQVYVDAEFAAMGEVTPSPDPDNPEQPEQPDNPEPTVVLYEDYSPNGEKFTSEASVDWNTQFIEADIDLTACTGSKENILSVGENIATWSRANSYHIKYMASSNALLIYAITGGGRPYGSCAQIYPSTKNVILRIDKDGVKVNGEALTESDYVFADGGIADGTGAMYTAFAEYIKTLSTVQIGSAEGSDRSHATYNYIKVDTVVPCTGITLDKTELVFDGQDSQTITATLSPVGANDPVVWVSSNPDVASISADGNVCTVKTAKENGSAVITVTCGDYSESCNVTVDGIATEALHPLTNGAVTNGVLTLEISNGNHVKIATTGSTGASAYINLSNIQRMASGSVVGAGNVTEDTENVLFSLKQGDVVESRATFTSLVNCTPALSIYTQPKTADFINGTASTSTPLTKTFTVGNDADITAIGLWTKPTSAWTIEFDLEVYVNDVRYI